MTEYDHIPADNCILVDGHVHFHRGCAVETFLSNAVTNMTRIGRAGDVATVSGFVLAMTEVEGEDGFYRLRREIARSDTSWSVHDTAEASSLRFERDGLSVVALRGWQLRTAESLEVLAIAPEVRPEDGLTVRATIEAVRQVGGIPIVPWGFGKWAGRRGRALRRLLETAGQDAFFLGDNANRRASSRWPRLFRMAQDRGLRLLPGSDPLPLAGECLAVGRAGFTVQEELDLHRPAAQLKAFLRDTSRPIHTFGVFETTPRFLRNQLRMQLLKRTLTQQE